jgi:hypothetical protein
MLVPTTIAAIAVRKQILTRMGVGCPWIPDAIAKNYFFSKRAALI